MSNGKFYPEMRNSNEMFWVRLRKGKFRSSRACLKSRSYIWKEIFIQEVCLLKVINFPVGTQVCVSVCFQWVILGVELGTVVFLAPFPTGMSLPTPPTTQKGFNLCSFKVLCQRPTSQTFSSYLRKQCRQVKVKTQEIVVDLQFPACVFFLVSAPGEEGTRTGFLPEHTGRILFCAELHLSPNVFWLKTEENNSFRFWKRVQVTKGYLSGYSLNFTSHWIRFRCHIIWLLKSMFHIVDFPPSMLLFFFFNNNCM